MFPSNTGPKLAQRALGAARLARSFLLLEDDYDVDWEVDQDEHAGLEHPHRAPLRRGIIERRLARRRPGQPEAPNHVCLSPVSPAGHSPARTPGACASSAGESSPAAQVR